MPNLIDTLSGIADLISANWPPKMPTPPVPPTWALTGHQVAPRTQVLSGRMK
jgi:hypothetical protein